MDGWQAIATFALAAVPGIFVLEIIQLRTPRLRERDGLRAVAWYLIVSAGVWAVAVLIFHADRQMASVIDSAKLGGEQQVTAYIALAWRLGATALGLGLVCRGAFAAARRAAAVVERRRREKNAWTGGRLGEALIDLVSISYAWDALLQRLRRRARAQVVRVRLKDGAIVYGVLAAGGFADFQADGRGLVLDVELLEEVEGLTEVPGSSGVFIAPDSVATVAFLDYPETDQGSTVGP